MARSLTSKAIGGMAIAATIVLVVAAAASAGCTAEVELSAPSLAVEGTTGVPTLQEDANGRAFSCNVGDTFNVQLEAAPIFGDRWVAALSQKDAALFEPIAEPVFVAYPTPGDVISDVGTYTFTFRAAATGKAVLRLELWDVNSTAPRLYQIYTVTLHIGAQGLARTLPSISPTTTTTLTSRLSLTTTTTLASRDGQ